MANNPKHKDNLKKPWKKGQSGNPKGKPAIVSDIKLYIRERLNEPPTKGADHTKLDAITAKLLTMAFAGNLKAMELCMAYGYGKPSQSIDIGATDGAKFTLTIE